MLRRNVVAALSVVCFILNTITATSQAGQLDMTFNPNDQGRGLGDGPNYEAYAITQQPDGNILVGGLFTVYNAIPSTGIIRIKPDGSVDSTFHSGSGFYGQVYKMVVQTDGKIIATGIFTSYNGTTCNNLARLNADGTYDSTFVTGTGLNNWGYSVCMQGAQVLVCGYFGYYNGKTANHLIRLNSDGSLDTTFNQGGVGANDLVTEVKIDANGAIWASGGFTSYNTNTILNEIVKLTPNGVPDGSFHTGLNLSGEIWDFDFEPDGKIIVGGQFTSIQGHAAKNIARLTATGTFDPTFATANGFDSIVDCVKIMPGGFVAAAGWFKTYSGFACNSIALLDSSGNHSSLLGLQNRHVYGFGYGLAVQADGKLLFAGGFQADGRRNLMRFNADYTMDAGFNNGNAFDNMVNDVELGPNGNLFAGGYFGGYDNVNINRVAELNADGSLDASFNSYVGPTNLNSQYNDYVFCVGPQADGKVLVGGPFAGYDSVQGAELLVRLNADGSYDTSFHHPFLTGPVLFVSEMNDGRIMICGAFGFQQCRYISRLLPDGAVDTTFKNTYINSQIDFYKLLSDGRIYVGGNFSSVHVPRFNIRVARLLPNGAVDSTFICYPGANGEVYQLDAQPDNKVIIGGAFTLYDSVPVNYIARIDTDGSLDTSFHSLGFDSLVSTVKVLPSGKILVGGNFLHYGGQPAPRLARLNADGSLDNTFNPGTGPDGDVENIVPLPSGEAIINGYFTSYNGTGRNRIARIFNEGPSGIAAVSAPDNINIFPNPTRSVFTVDAGQTSIEQISIFDLTGKEIKRELPGRPRITISTNFLAPGIYLVNVKTTDGMFCKKLVVE